MIPAPVQTARRIPCIRRLTVPLALTLSLLGGCDEMVVEGVPEEVRVVSVVYDEETGTGDYYTIVEFPDGSRRKRSGKWGETGDRFLAQRGNDYDSWLSPKGAVDR